MSLTNMEESRREIEESLALPKFCMHQIGLSFKPAKSNSSYWQQKIMFFLSVSSVGYLVFGEVMYIGLTLASSTRVEDVVRLFHICGYGTLSIAKVFVLWYKKDVFSSLIEELGTIWPVPPLDKDAQTIKDESIAALKIAHKWVKPQSIVSLDKMEESHKEIEESLAMTKFCMRRIGLSFKPPKSFLAYCQQKFMFFLTVASVCYHVFAELMYIGLTLADSPHVEDVVPLFHLCGYGMMSIAKVFVLWYKKDVFNSLIEELSTIWPVPPLDKDAQAIKDESLKALKIAQRWYFAMNELGVWFYNITPIAIYFYQLWQGQDAQMGFVWVSWYPFDKRETKFHIAAYIYEMFAGQSSVWIMISTDLLFATMASHICLLLRLLQKRLESLGSTLKTNDEYYEEILENIKLHQRLITYCNDLKEAFSVSNLINIVISSVNICCVVFVIVLLEPFVAVSNKLYLGSALIQIGLISWYGDAILHANADIATSAYKSGWYKMDPRCRRALQFLIIRAQKPIAFTAMEFTNISLVTYSSILTRSYSYFALLYTMYSDT